MADGDLYLTDILAWSEQQAEVLRQLGRRPDLPNALDLAHVVEEIEDVGLSELNAMRSFMRLIMVHVIKCWAEPESPALSHWMHEIINWQSELSTRLTRSMRQRVDLSVQWQRAIRQVRREAQADAAAGQQMLAALVRLPEDCPFTCDDLASDETEPSALVARLPA